MSLKNVSTGGGLVVVGLGLCAIAGAMVVAGSGGAAHASGLPSGAMVASAAMAQGGGEPVVVWYGVVPQVSNGHAGALFRAWSDGRIEAKVFYTQSAGTTNLCANPFYIYCDWVPFSNPNDGLAAFSDLNADGKVDAVDLSQVLSRWGDAPRNDIPPSDCPLNLINP